MEVYEAIEKRRSIRIYKQEATEEQLRKIILAGTKAPSAANRQPWEFIIIHDLKTIDQLGEIKYQQNRLRSPRKGEEGRDGVEKRALDQKRWFKNASVVAVCNQRGFSSSCWLCIENMCLAAVADGLGSNIVTYEGKYKEEVEKILGIPEDYELTTIIKFGVPGEEGHPRDKNSAGLRRPEFSWLHREVF